MRRPTIQRTSLVAVIASSGCALGGAESEAPPTPPAVVELAAGQVEEIVPGTIVRVGRLMFSVPEPGDSVTAEGITELGEAHIAELHNDDRGFVSATLEVRPPPAHDIAAACAAPTDCNDTAYAFHKWTWNNRTYRWSFNESSVPSSLDANAVRSMIVTSANHWTFGHNDCGIPLRTNNEPRTEYLGTTTRTTNISVEGVCGSKDGHSVIGFDVLNGWLAYSCNWRSGWFWSDDAHEGDIRLNSTLSFYTSVDAPAGCSGSYGIEQVMTHELGHTFGIAHSDECVHGQLTMSPNMTSCSRANASLAAGDLKGLADKYD